jgi:hypothetical protein
MLFMLEMMIHEKVVEKIESYVHKMFMYIRWQRETSCHHFWAQWKDCTNSYKIWLWELIELFSNYLLKSISILPPCYNDLVLVWDNVNVVSQTRHDF